MNIILKNCRWISLAALLPGFCLAAALSDTPLSLKGGVPPNVMFALSVEFPTANTAAYQDSASYDSNNEYLGYFDPDKCYDYDTTNGWFYPIVTTHPDTHKCAIRWSGNLLNWASMTGLDEFRFAMTGGNRYQDTSTLTVLERSYQSGQGGTSNFPDKTFIETDGFSTTFSAGSSIRFQSQGRGVQMVVTPTGSTDVANCTSPTLVGTTFGCTLSLQSDPPKVANCNTWAGSGTIGSPYRCSSFGSFPAVGTPTSATAVTPAATFSTSGTTDTVSCTSPTLVGTNFNCGSLSLVSNGHTGSCLSGYTGDGSSTSPYRCATFNPFSSGENFTLSGAPETISTFNVTTPGAQQVYPISGFTPCNIYGTGSSTTIECTLANGNKASCSNFTGSGNNINNAKYCASFGYPSGEVHVAQAHTGGTQYNNGQNTRYYSLNYRLTYLLPPTTTTYYYSSAYPGNIAGVTKYYTGSYNLTFSTAQTFNVRVKVCDSSIGPESNCVAYGSSLKPTGVIQNNGDKMRFGVSSYFQANDIDNAVLRSKLKYVAPQMYSPSGGVGTNPRTEWSATDGTLYLNPDSTDSATATSVFGATSVTNTNTGVINYINKFGSASRSYKTYDDVGKLYYETLKYLRGNTPTTEFYNGATAANSDGFPVITTWQDTTDPDPILFSCQKNYIISMGDTHTHCDRRLPGGTFTSSGAGQCNAYNDANGNAHASDFGNLGNETGVNVSTSTRTVGQLESLGNGLATSTPSGSTGSYYMAGLAAWAASTDIRPGTAANIIGKQTVTSYIIDVQEYKDCGYQSQFWLAGKYGNPSSYDANGTWIPQASQTGAQQWWSTQSLPAGLCSSRAPAAALGNPAYSATGGSVTWPKNLLRAGDPLSMITSVQNAIAAIVAQIGDEAALAQSSGKLDTGTGAYIYRALYNSGGWRGNLQALVIDTSGNISSTPAWSASEQLPLPSARNIFTFNDGLDASGASETIANMSRRGVAFSSAAFASNFSTGQQARLNADNFGTSDGLGVDRVDYVRGEQSKEIFYPVGSTTPNPNPNNGWRARLPWGGENRFTLGDIINSNPVFVGAPSSGISDASYKTFANAQANRVPMVYVGGNDGMLHGFDASFTVGSSGLPVPTSTSGKEMFAYVPSAVYSNLSQLMSPNYAHKYYVDGSTTVADACFWGAGSSCPSLGTGWKTVLVGSLKAGGQGIFALDVTNPVTTTLGVNSNNFSSSNVLWEFTDADDPDMGYTFSLPIIRKLNNDRWAVIFGNGFNNTFSDSRSSSTGRAYLYILYIDGPGVNGGNGTGNPWVLGTNYFKIELRSPSEVATPVNPPNGLASITGFDKDFNGTVDYVYGGDRNGNLWKIDLTSNTPGNWKSAFGSVSSPTPLFTAIDTVSPTPNAQQITTGVEIGRNPLGGYLLQFGTGSWIDITDPLVPFKSQSFYGIWDKDDGTTTVARSNLQRQTTLVYIDNSGNVCQPGAAGCNQIVSSCQPNYTSTSGPANSNSSTFLCPSSLGYTSSTPPQLGWVFDLPNSGERTRSSAPQLSGNRVTFTTLTPATDPCTGNTIGLEYNLNYRTGGTPPSPVFLSSSSPSGMITIAANSTAATNLGLPTGTSIQVIASGQTIAGGATDNPVNFSANLPSSIYTPPAGIPSPPATACQGSYGGTCPDYIPGWGFLFNQLGGLAKGILSCGPQEIGSGLPTCVWKTVPYQAGRLNWKQITR